MADGHMKQDSATLYSALCAAQASFGEVVKNTKGARGKYAPLDAVLEAIVPALNKHGLILMQPTRIEGEALVLETRIIHAATGESLSCSYPVAPLGKPHQETGASLTYSRRYSVLSLCGVAPENEDDDDTRQQSNATPKAPAKISEQAKPEQKVTPKVFTLDQRIEGCKAHLSKAKDADDAIIRWEDPRTEGLRTELEKQAPDKLDALADYYGQVLSRFDEPAFS